MILKELLDRLIEKNKVLVKQGKVANYIPLLGNADPKDLGICVIDSWGTYTLAVSMIKVYNSKHI